MGGRKSFVSMMVYLLSAMPSCIYPSSRALFVQALAWALCRLRHQGEMRGVQVPEVHTQQPQAVVVYREKGAYPVLQVPHLTHRLHPSFLLRSADAAFRANDFCARLLSGMTSSAIA